MQLNATTLVRCAACSLIVTGPHTCVEPRDVPESNFERCVRGIAEERIERRQLIAQLALAKARR